MKLITFTDPFIADYLIPVLCKGYSKSSCDGTDNTETGIAVAEDATKVAEDEVGEKHKSSNND